MISREKGVAAFTNAFGLDRRKATLLFARRENIARPAAMVVKDPKVVYADGMSDEAIYTMTQTDDMIHSGDLIINRTGRRTQGPKIVLLYEAWPVLVYGDGPTELHMMKVTDAERLRGPFAKSFALAKREAEKLGILGQNRIK